MNVGFKDNSSLKEQNKKNRFFSYFSFDFRTIFIIVLVLLIITFFTFLFKSSNYQILYKNLSNEDEKLVVSQLTRMNIPFKFSDNHANLLVPESQFQKAQINLSNQGLPKGNSIGFELLDQEKFGISQFNEQINYQRALEGELSRSIQKLNNIKTARVHISLPKPSLFIQENKLPSVSVILGIKDGLNIDSGQINAILHMVSGSISGLSVDNITIIDQEGRLLNSNDSFDSNINSVKLKYYNLIEDHYKQRIENILVPLVGLNNVHAQVTAQINFDIKDKTEETYKPNYNNSEKSIRSHHNSSTTELNEKYVDNSVSPESFSEKLQNFSHKLSSSSNNLNENSSKKLQLDNFSKKNFNNALTLPKSSVNQDYIVNYELDHMVAHSKLQIGDVKRLSAAVVINYVRNNDGKFVSLNSHQIKKIENLVRESIGFSSKRGDTISIVNALFVKPSIQTDRYVSFWNKPVFLSDFLKYGLMCVCVTIILYLLYRTLFLKKIIMQSKIDDLVRNDTLEDKQKTFNAEFKNSEDLFKKKGFSNLFKNDPHIIAAIIRKWMGGDKK